MWHLQGYSPPGRRWTHIKFLTRASPGDVSAEEARPCLLPQLCRSCVHVFTCICSSSL